jgi:hypothetical protein
MNADRLLDIISHFYKHPHLTEEEQEMIDDLIEIVANQLEEEKK